MIKGIIKNMIKEGFYMEKYVLALDTSLSNTGYCIFDESGKPLKVGSIATKSKNSHGERLKIIANVFLDLRKQYDIDVVIFEKGFSRYYASTQALFKVIGVANYIFHDCEIIYYAPATIKKIVCGNGRANKELVQQKMKKTFPFLQFDNCDQSDAVSVGYVYFLDKGVYNE